MRTLDGRECDDSQADLLSFHNRVKSQKVRPNICGLASDAHKGADADNENPYRVDENDVADGEI